MKINVKGVPETMIQTLYARAKETSQKNPQIKDEMAVSIVKQLDYDFSQADQDKTMVSMSILNTTTQKVEDESLNAILIGDNENVLGQMETWIQSLSAGEQYDISVILNGNLTGTKLIKLEKVTNNQ